MVLFTKFTPEVIQVLPPKITFPSKDTITKVPTNQTQVGSPLGFSLAQLAKPESALAELVQWDLCRSFAFSSLDVLHQSTKGREPDGRFYGNKEFAPAELLLIALFGLHRPHPGA
jgi:hypothetical protein